MAAVSFLTHFLTNGGAERVGFEPTTYGLTGGNHRKAAYKVSKLGPTDYVRRSNQTELPLQMQKQSRPAGGLALSLRPSIKDDGNYYLHVPEGTVLFTNH